jgi:hypothetical protein
MLKQIFGKIGLFDGVDAVNADMAIGSVFLGVIELIAEVHWPHLVSKDEI